MYAGYVVESGPAEAVLADPKHPYTQLLLSAVPDPRAPLAVGAETDKGEPPKVIDPTPGCRFRCALPAWSSTSATRSTPPLQLLGPEAHRRVPRREAGRRFPGSRSRSLEYLTPSVSPSRKTNAWSRRPNRYSSSSCGAPVSVSVG